MDRSTKQNAASLAEVAASAAQLQSVASVLYDVVVRFRTAGDDGRASSDSAMRQVA